MTQFLRLLKENDKGVALASTAARVRSGEDDPRRFEVDPASFEAVPGAPFAYWVTNRIWETFQRLPPFEGERRTARVGLQTSDDFRFVRVWWEIDGQALADDKQWFPFAKGGSSSRFYADVSMAVNWGRKGTELTTFSGSVIRNAEFYFHPGISWPLRGIAFSAQAVPRGCVFSIAGKMALAPAEELPVWLSLFNSQVFDRLVRMCAGRVIGAQYEVGLIGKIPVPAYSEHEGGHLSPLSLRSWFLKRTLDTITETSHVFLLPALLRPRLGPYDPPAIEAELARIQQEIDDICFDLYGFDEADRAAMTETTGPVDIGAATEGDGDQDDGDNVAVPIDGQAELLSWCVGVAFGRFDWRLATGEREAPVEPGPFDPLPAKSPGMLPDGVPAFHSHGCILVDDKGDPHDLPHLVEEVLMRVNIPVPGNVREWLRQGFFAFHLQHYSKSRRKAPIYWPLSTNSGSYTLWAYYSTMTDQTLYTAVNDFVEPKLTQVTAELTNLRAKAAKRTHDEEKRLEELEVLEDELTDLRDTLLKIAPTYHPDQDDGVQISAAPLWPLFRDKPWQKLLKETWAKLEKGDYDWSHLAMNYWPDRVRQKCKTDKSLAIAHGLEDLHMEPERHERTPRSRRQ